MYTVLSLKGFEIEKVTFKMLRNVKDHRYLEEKNGSDRRVEPRKTIQMGWSPYKTQTLRCEKTLG